MILRKRVNLNDMVRRKFIYFSVAVNILLILMFLIYAANHREAIIQKIIKYRNNATVIMFGDSHTARVDWCLLLNRYDVLKMGYGAFTSEQLLNKLKGNLNDYAAEYCFIQCGGNDINSRCYSRELTIKNIETIIDEIKSQNITPVVQSLFHRYNDPKYNAEVDSLNILLTQLASEEMIDFLNINMSLTANHDLKNNFGKDRIHLSENSYKIWAGIIREYLDKTKNGFGSFLIQTD